MIKIHIHVIVDSGDILCVVIVGDVIGFILEFIQLYLKNIIKFAVCVGFAVIVA